MEIHGIALRLSTGGLLALGMALAPGLSAQENSGSDENFSPLEVITVTAQRREQPIQEVPVSVTVFSGDALRELGFQSSMDIANQVPNLQTAQNFGEANNPIVSIRGVTMLDFSEINESPSAVYVDNFYKANLAGLDFQLFDLEKAEILRGPQGTLFGRNTTGGLIHYTTRRPSHAPDGYAEVTLSDFGQRKLEFAAGGGLSETVAGRLSLVWNQHDGYVENVGWGDANDLDSYALRGQLLMDPSESASVLLSLQYGRNDSDGNPFIHHASALDPVTGLAIDAETDFAGYSGPPLKARQAELSQRLALETEVTTALLRIDYELPWADFLSVTGYERVNKEQRQDPDASPNDIFRTNTFARGRQLSQEFQLQGDRDRFRWITGAFFFSYKNTGEQFADVPPFGISPNVTWSADTNSWAVFGQLEFELADKWTAIAGTRYTDEHKSFQSNIEFLSYPDGVFLEAAQVFTPDTAGDLTRQNPTNSSWRLALNYQPTEDHLLYASASTGFKGGTYNLGFFPQPGIDVIPVRPEEITAYELGFKSTVADGRARVNGAVFYYDYEDYQAFLFDGETLSTYLFNNNAKVTGAELELFSSPAENLDVIMGFSWLDSRLLAVPDRADLVGGTPEVRDRHMPLAPGFSANAVVRYGFEAIGGQAYLQADGFWVDETYFDPLNSPALREPSYYQANLRATWNSSDQGWYVTAFVENLTDETYRNYSFDLTAAIGALEDIVNRPRLWGVTVGLRW